MTKQEMRDAAASLRGLLAAIEAGKMTAGAAMVYRLEGAVIALEAVAVGRAPTLERLYG